jgi:hypothetical protein
MRGFLAIGIVLSCLSCGTDPVLEAARREAAAEHAGTDEKDQPTSVSPKRAHPMDGGSPTDPSVPGDHSPGVPDEPVPGVPTDPSPDGVGTPGPGMPDAPVPGVPTGPTHVEGQEPKPGNPAEGVGKPPTTGPMVTLSGHISFDGYQGGGVRIDVFDGEHVGGRAGKRPSLVNSVTVTRLGPWSLEVPQELGQVWIEASNDENNNGRPDPRDPMGHCSRNPVSTKKSVGGLKIHLVRREAPGGEADDL